ncbi:type II toxin-antitoxin system VapB family antitoxin [Mycobacterium avium]|uniref:type II toxin-antitoxin system VapB family antitoxin n=1 Tax=Mycobacterium avium TaxID=1764 RepID=UPI000A01D48F|nr:hypothetical protein [Mycobacterium avium]
MGDVLIRGLTDKAVARIDADAKARGLSRQEYLRQRFEAEGESTVTPARRGLTIDDLRRAAEAAVDLDAPDVMDAAWR